MSEDWVVRLPTWLGDTIMALPTLRALERSCPRSMVLWGPAAHAELLDAFALRFDALPYRRRKGLPGVSDAISAIAELRRRRAEVALLLPNAFEAALLARLAGIPRRIGYATDGRSVLLTDALEPPEPRNPVHEADRFAGLIGALGIDPPVPADALLRPTATLSDRAAEILADDAEYFGIVAGSANSPAKRWDPEAYGRLAEQASAQYGATPLLLGSDADRPITEQVAGSCRVPVTDMAGCSITDLAAALLRCRVVVGNDTGALHLSAALGRPTVVIYGPTDPRRCRPRGERVAAITADCFCQPCEAAVCPLDRRCMTGVEVPSVLAAAGPFWQADA